ncbi:hypothetical protein DSO57_1029743 [Entomophthora muscae]|uniref:Uncharacterized protein n=2 Tax=Entomophthora muscae TaxID=34485 RepID=A0ACC2SQA6_9FUNG|nr:hypothetical protein DSO57_1013185 [Entomophthora muscae]KAJ9064515.1 hypothetical protein DSO57_1029743 [Entomophthora muscae]
MDCNLDFSSDLLAKNFTVSYSVAHAPLSPKSQNIHLPSIKELGIGLSPPPSSPSFDGNMQAIRRHRVTPLQKERLTYVFKTTFFPSTELRNQLAIDLNMTPRAVQIWFQNKRQAWRQKLKPRYHSL